MRNRTSAVVFLFVIFVMCLGAWAAFSTLTKGRGSDVVAVESWTATLEVDATGTPSTPAPTQLPAETPTPHSELTTPVAPTATPIPPATPTSPPPPSPTPSPTPTRSGAESTLVPPSGPTPVPPSGPHQYVVIPNERDCSRGQVIGGWVYDSSGDGLPWANVYLYNDYGWSASKQSEGPPQTGKYEFTMGFDAGLFRILIVDGAGQPLSAVIEVNYEPECSYRIDWQRIG